MVGGCFLGSFFSPLFFFDVLLEDNFLNGFFPLLGLGWDGKYLLTMSK